MQNSTTQQLRVSDSALNMLISRENDLGNRVSTKILKEDYFHGNIVEITISYPPFDTQPALRQVNSIKGECRVIAA